MVYSPMMAITSALDSLALGAHSTRNRCREMNARTLECAPVRRSSSSSSLLMMMVVVVVVLVSTCSERPLSCFDFEYIQQARPSVLL